MVYPCVSPELRPLHNLRMWPGIENEVENVVDLTREAGSVGFPSEPEAVYQQAKGGSDRGVGAIEWDLSRRREGG